jgi:4-hydroxythreonine-4-phosphate dehydrogenase
MAGRTERLKVGITLGDITGIGPEVIIKSFLDERIFKLFTPIVFGNPKVISFYRKLYQIEKLQYTTVKSLQQLSNNSLNILPVWEEEVVIKPGQPDETSGKYAFLSLQAACEALKNGEIDVLVTAPIHKKHIHTEEFPFTGHTQYLAEYFGEAQVLMFMVSEQLRVGLVTEHLPIHQVASAITKENILAKLRLMHHSLKVDFGIDKPRIAVLGLNPHAGDEGLIGQEEQEVIIPAIKEAKQEGILTFGPYPADGFFGSKSHQSFDAVLAMYHDQGLIPFKSLSFGTGTNFTAGMKVVRTSPDHGTADKISGKDMADAASFIQAMYTAIDIFEQRERFKDNNANPLQKLANLREERG